MIRRALALLLALAPAAARAQVPPEDPRALAGQPVLALASHPAVTLTLRQSSGGRQSAVARLARAPGPPLRVTPDGQVVYGWGCGAAGCGADGLFLGYDAVRERLFVVLFAESQSLLWVPPRASRWPATLEAPIAEFSPEIAQRMRFAAP